jgi:hypothetical protein
LGLFICFGLFSSADIYATLHSVTVYSSGDPQMSNTTIRKLRREGNGASDTGYYLLPPRIWLEAVEKKEGKKILGFTLKSEEEGLVLDPMFENPRVEPPRNGSPELVTLMLLQGTLISKLREVHKGNNIYRIIYVPRAWVKGKEQERNRKVIALSVTTKSASIFVAPVFANKPGSR